LLKIKRFCSAGRVPDYFEEFRKNLTGSSVFGKVPKDFEEFQSF